MYVLLFQLGVTWALFALGVPSFLYVDAATPRCNRYFLTKICVGFENGAENWAFRIFHKLSGHP